MAKDDPNDPLVPFGYGNKKMRLSELLKSAYLKDLDASMQANLARMLRENPSIGVGESERSDEQVAADFRERYAPLKSEPDFYDPKVYRDSQRAKLKEFGGKIYQLKKNFDASAAPNASWHAGGYAVDLVGDRELAGKIAEKYGIRQVRSTGENWHFQPAGVPDGRRVIDFVKNRYGRDILAEPLDNKALTFFNDRFASNAPYHPPKVLSEADMLLGLPIAPEYGTKKAWTTRNNPKPPAVRAKEAPRIQPKGNNITYR